MEVHLNQATVAGAPHPVKPLGFRVFRFDAAAGPQEEGILLSFGQRPGPLMFLPVVA